MKNKFKKFIDYFCDEKDKKISYKLTKLEIIIIVSIFIVMFVWSCKAPAGGFGPDEVMRYNVPLYIYNHGKLPLPDNKEVISTVFNASYAYYPLMLGSIVSAFFMKIVSFFSKDPFILLVAARFLSVLCGTLFVYFMIKIAKRIFKTNKIGRYFMIFFVGFIPQLSFLSCYVNNDIIALLGVVISIYSWLLFMDDKENKKYDYLLAIGTSIIIMSYYNAYGFVLASGLFFTYLFIKKDKKKKISFDYKNFLKRGLIIATIVLVSCGYLFIRSAVVNNGDMLGMKSFLAASEKSTYPNIPMSKRNTPKNLGMSVFEALTTHHYVNTSWFNLTIKSYIGVFGPMAYQVSNYVYLIFGLIILIGMIGLLLKLKEIFKKKEWLVFYSCMTIGMLITVGLSIYYTYATDYQPQGRYIFPTLVGVAIMVSVGIEKLLSFFKKYKSYNYIRFAVYSIMIILIVVCFVSANKTFFTSIPMFIHKYLGR